MAVKSKLDSGSYNWPTVEEAEKDLEAKEFTDLFYRVEKYQDGPVTSHQELSYP